MITVSTVGDALDLRVCLGGAAWEGADNLALDRRAEPAHPARCARVERVLNRRNDYLLN